MTLQIVFVYLGDKIPRYALNNIKLTQKTFPDNLVTVVVNSEELHSKLTKFGVSAFRLDLSEESKSINYSHFDLTFRKSFWRYSSERLFALLEFQALNKLPRIFHLELDVLLLPSFPFERTLTSPKIIWGAVSEDQDAAAMLYIPSLESGAWLLNELHSKYASGKYSDMTALRDISLDNPEIVSYFPLLFLNETQGESKDNREFVNDAFLDSDRFDAATLGMYLTGTDPRNNKALSTLYKVPNGHWGLPNSIKYKFAGKNLHAILSEEKSYTIHNLHVHSKNNFLFKSNYWLLQLFIQLSRFNHSLHLLYPNHFFTGIFRVTKKRFKSSAKN